MASTIWSRENPLFPAHQVSSRSQHSASKHLQMCYYAGFKGSGVFCVVPGTAVQYLTYSFVYFIANCAFVTRTNRVVFERNLHLLTLRIASLFAASARSGRVVPENSRIALVICSRRWTWGGYYRC